MSADKNSCTPEEVEAEYSPRRKPAASSNWPTFECVHCHSEFRSGGDLSVPICEWCLHRD